MRTLQLIAQQTVGNRPGRIEPRAIKRRRNAYPLLTNPRQIAQEIVRKNGHPKKLKKVPFEPGPFLALKNRAGPLSRFLALPRHLMTPLA